MIDLNKERELFESKFKKAHWVEYDEKRNKYFCPYVADSEANKYDLMWQVWQFSIDREGYILIPCEQLNQWSHMANYAQEYGCPECFEARGYAHSLACEINSYFEPNNQGEQ